MTDEELEEIANQLGCPSGALGSRVGHTMNKTNRGMILNSIKNLELNNGDTVLEIGHGNCGHLPQMLSYYNGIEYWGLETSELMHNEAKDIGNSLNEEKINFCLYDGTTIPFKENRFDKIFTVNTIYFWTPPSTMIKEIARVLKPGGLFALTFSDNSYMAQQPFTKFRFNLYDTETIKQFFIDEDLQIHNCDCIDETFLDKGGKPVSRRFTTIVVKK